MDFLTSVSAMIAATEQGSPPDDREMTLAQLVEVFIGVDFAQTTAALRVIEQLTDDERLSARIADAVRRRSQPVPTWIERLGETTVSAVHRASHVLGDGESYLLDVKLSGSARATAVVYVDHTLGLVVKDAFAANAAVEYFLAQMPQHLDEHCTLEETDPAVARAVIEEAIRRGAMFLPPFETDTWPHHRAALDWLLRLLPDGASRPESHEWTDDELGQIAQGFWASDLAAGLVDDEDRRYLLDTLLWFSSSYGDADPRRWSPVRVGIVMTDWFPRTVVAEPDELAPMPSVLRALIRYCHRERSVPPALTAETLQAVDRWDAEFQRRIRTERPQGAEAFARMLAGHGQPVGAPGPQ